MAMMISKFHKIIQSKVVWIVFAGLICIAFVWSFSGAKTGKQKARNEAAKEAVGKLYGKEVTRIEFGREYQNAYLMLLLRTGQPINITPQVRQYLRQTAWQRLAILEKAEQMGLRVSQDQLGTAIRQQPVFRNPQTGAFDRRAYDDFFNQILPRIGIRMTTKDFEVMISNNLLIEKASSMAVQSALVTDAEVDQAFHIYSDKLTVQYAAIPRSLAPAPEVTEEDARKYYDSYPNQFVYPDKVKVRYVEFPVADYADGIEISDEIVVQAYEANKQQFVVAGTEGNVVPEYQPLDEVKDTIVDDLTSRLARSKAANDAGVFVSRLSDQTATFDELAKATGKTIASTPPFALTDSVKGVDTNAPFARAAFRLEDNEHHYYSDPVVGRDSVYVIALQAKKPSFLPDYDVVAEKAMSAARITATEKAYFEKAEAVHAALEAALKSGSTFEEAASQAGLKTATTDPFSVAEPPEDELGQSILRQTVLYDAGTLADLIPTEDEFVVAYVAGKEAADRFMADPNLIDQLKASVQNDKASRLVDAWRESLLEEAQFEDLLQDTKANDNS